MDRWVRDDAPRRGLSADAVSGGRGVGWASGTGRRRPGGRTWLRAEGARRDDPGAVTLDASPHKGPSGGRSGGMLGLLILAAFLSFCSTAALVVLAGLPLLWSVPVYGIIGAVLTVVLAAVALAVSGDPTDPD